MKMQLTRQKFTLLLLLLTAFTLGSCKSDKAEKAAENQTETAAETTTEKASDPFFKLSLAQWSIHRMILEDGMDPFDFAVYARDNGFAGLEYVSQLYNSAMEEYDTKDEAIKAITQRLKAESEEAGMENLIIMIDGEGDLSVNDEAARDQAVENHKRWVDAAAELGCHSIRINLFGSLNDEEWKANSIDGLSKLGAYAQTKGVNVLVENHGWQSSNAPLLMEVINAVGMDNCGTLPDFGNFCVKRKDGAKWGECEEEYPDIYEGVQLMMPAAKAVSAKSYDFDEEGNETKIDYAKMLRIVKEAGYTGYIGVEYEGNNLSEQEGIEATRDLLIELGSSM
ncbi:sugar phosphate isomerase/epimerase family protein [Gilvibacter sediminis]|uniref:sugar phosphate isomerase/epimerase family protein n=1 Tax=Gilvibacter sediminis TaxID=379071 RepID=UPI002350C4FE|nr:sugar phosphate isomerase/epimerase family protein [Gilvibacter sediminis]MDC7998697.1 sugar phosphate isomerase/epimerase [Gilvibacter sediminis]